MELVRCVWPFWMPVVLVAIEGSVRGPPLSSKERSTGSPTKLETKTSSMTLLPDNGYVGPEKIEQVQTAACVLHKSIFIPHCVSNSISQYYRNFYCGFLDLTYLIYISILVCIFIMGSAPSRPAPQMQQIHWLRRCRCGGKTSYKLIDETEKCQPCKLEKERRKSTYKRALRTKVGIDGNNVVLLAIY